MRTKDFKKGGYYIDLHGNDNIYHICDKVILLNGDINIKYNRLNMKYSIGTYSANTQWSMEEIEIIKVNKLCPKCEFITINPQELIDMPVKSINIPNETISHKKTRIPENINSPICIQCKNPNREIDLFTGKSYYCPNCEP